MEFCVLFSNFIGGWIYYWKYCPCSFVVYDVNELFVQSHGLPDVPHDHDWTVENEKLKRRNGYKPEDDTILEIWNK